MVFQSAHYKRQEDEEASSEHFHAAQIEVPLVSFLLYLFIFLKKIFVLRYSLQILKRDICQTFSAIGH